MGFIFERNPKRMNRWYFGGIGACAATMFTHPLDLLKVLLQTQKDKGSLATSVKMVYQNDGMAGFYSGLSASLLRQITYTNARIAIYEVGKNFANSDTVLQKTMLAITAGTLSGAVGVPMDVVNVRMQNDMKLPPSQRRNYKHVGDGLAAVYREGGAAALFSGGTFAVVRGCFMTIGQNVVYDEAKALIRKATNMRDGLPLHMCSSVCAACVATLLTQPIDVVKTRKMNAAPGEFKGNLDVIMKTAKEGPLAFFKGIIPAFLRLGPQTILLFIFMEQLRLHFGYLKKDDGIEKTQHTVA